MESHNAHAPWTARTLPLSYPGAWLAVSRTDGARSAIIDALHLRSLRNGFHRRDLLRLRLLHADGRVETPAADVLTPGRLDAEGDGATLSATFESPLRVRLRAHGAGLRLDRPGPSSDVFGQGPAIEFAGPCADGAWRLIATMAGMKLRVLPVRGALRVHAPIAHAYLSDLRIDVLPDAEGVAELALDEYVNEWDGQKPTAPFDAVAARSRDDFDAFLAKVPSFAPEHADTRRMAAYVLWSSIVAPAAPMSSSRRGVLMSKHWMNSVWSWDHAFNAVALASVDADLAWDQWALPFDAQDAAGALPDCLSAGFEARGYVKPPIHGWALAALRRAGVATPERLHWALPRLERWTDWWFRERDESATGLPEYYHGNDSGWDNASLLDGMVPCSSPDLVAYLVMQMDALADAWDALDDPARGASWRERADRLLDRLVREFWRDGRFVVRGRPGARSAEGTDSLLAFMPLALGRRLPADIAVPLADGVMEAGRFLTPWGLATESTRSPHFQPDGYWLGPVWAPPTVLIAHGLRDRGRREAADDLSARFLRLCARGGMAENFNALEGTPNRDPAYTWTAAAALLLGAV